MIFWRIAAVCVTVWGIANSNESCPDGNTFTTPENPSTRMVPPPMITSSLGRVTGRESSVPLQYDRVSSLANSDWYSFVHISKCGGSSFIEWANDHKTGGGAVLKTFKLKIDNGKKQKLMQVKGQERGNLFDLATTPHATRLVFLRSPRAHVLSMFKECKYSPWGKKTIQSRKKHGLETIPHQGSHVRSHQHGLAEVVSDWTP